METKSTKPGAPNKALTKDTINRNILKAHYAVRGEIAIRSEEIKHAIKDKSGKFDFDHVISAEIGNPQQLGQKPLTFFRQVVSLMEYPDLLKPENRAAASQLYAKDAIERASYLYTHIVSVGAYSVSKGVLEIRKDVAAFIQSRDGGSDRYRAEPEDIFLTSGASQGVNYILNAVIREPSDGVMIPIPQYPLYSAAIALLGGTQVDYYLDELQNWSLDLANLNAVYKKQTGNGVHVKAIAVINPGNPTGGCLPIDDIKGVLQFCASNKVICLADEVYQTNTFNPETRPFVSFKKVLRDLQAQGECEHVELVSFHSTSKGMIGECGQRGGYFELVGIDPDVKEQIYKVASINLCSPIIGQVMVDLMVRPPQPGDVSYEQYRTEYNTIFNALKDRSQNLHKAFGQMEGVECQEAQGAMYLFPKMTLPESVYHAAKAEGFSSPDEFYCMKLLEMAGIATIPGSGFGQKQGELHFRTTFLAPGNEAADRLTRFHKQFLEKYT